MFGGKMKIITGASRGIGKYLFDRYADEGEWVEGTFFHTEPTRKLYGEFLDNLPRVNYSYVDVCEYYQVEDWINRISPTGPGKIELINCAGIKYDSITHYALPSFWKRVIEVNLIGTFNVIRAILPRMREIGYGRIINMSSVVDSLGVPGTSAYAASKAGLEGLTKVLAVENAINGITVNNLRLGYFDIGMGREISPLLRGKIGTRIPTHEFGKPENTYDAMNFLINNAYVNGSSLTIDGGLA
jgi:acetoacetyl-CoA reductase/3-oxoacyl-[acyl-carrier protein] reductase